MWTKTVSYQFWVKSSTQCRNWLWLLFGIVVNILDTVTAASLRAWGLIQSFFLWRSRSPYQLQQLLHYPGWLLLLSWCFPSTETIRLIRDLRWPPQLSHSSWALRLWWWWCRASCPWMLADILGTNCDQCWSTVQCCFTSTETVRLIRMKSPGRPPRLSRSSWTLISLRLIPLRPDVTVMVDWA